MTTLELIEALNKMSTDQLKEFCAFLDMLLEQQKKDQSGSNNAGSKL